MLPDGLSDAVVGGITRSGSPGSYSYTVKPGFANKPVVYVSFWDALRFANWLDNGQGSGDTETGAYTLTPEAIAGNSVLRNPDADTFLPDVDEWYKAAYYAGGGVYFGFPTGTNTATGCVLPVADTGNSANCDGVVGGLTDVGAYPLSESPFGTFDQGGNASEWIESDETEPDSERPFRGGDWDRGPGELGSSASSAGDPMFSFDIVGFRVASRLPEPGAAWPAIASLAALAALARRRQRAR